MMSAPVAGDRFISIGGFLTRAMTLTEILLRYPLANPVRTKWQDSFTTSGNHDGPTVPSGRRALILSSKQYVSGAVSIGALMLKRASTYYQLGPQSSANTSVNSAAYAGFVFDENDTIAVNHAALSNRVNYTFDILYFDKPSSGPRGLFTAVVLDLASGNNTIVTCGGGYSIEFPILGSSFSSPIGHVMNNSGGNIAVNSYQVPSGGSPDSTNQMNSLTAQATNARATLVPSSKLEAGDSLIFSTDTVGNQVGWATCFEGVF